MAHIHPETERVLREFAHGLHLSEIGNPADTDRFLDFIIAAYHKADRDIAPHELLDIVQSELPNPQNDAERKKRLGYLMYLHSRYEDGIALLAKLERDGSISFT